MIANKFSDSKSEVARKIFLNTTEKFDFDWNLLPRNDIEYPVKELSSPIIMVYPLRLSFFTNFIDRQLDCLAESPRAHTNAIDFSGVFD